MYSEVRRDPVCSFVLHFVFACIFSLYPVFLPWRYRETTCSSVFLTYCVTLGVFASFVCSNSNLLIPLFGHFFFFNLLVFLIPSNPHPQGYVSILFYFITKRVCFENGMLFHRIADTTFNLQRLRPIGNRLESSAPDHHGLQIKCD